jgi:ferric-dicitrate binding protein FerR (iron transport regulator)
MEDIIRKYLENTATDQEKESLLQWLRNRENIREFNIVKKSWKAGLNSDTFPGEGKEIWMKIQSGLLERGFAGWQKSRRISQILRYAAILFFLTTIGSITLYLTNRPAKSDILVTTIVAENGQMSKVMLPDLSVVWLNSASEIRYDNQYGVKNRKISLQGEAYFDISKDESLPVVVDCNELQVKVTGTKFNVNAFPGSEQISVVLEEGSVDILKDEIPGFRYSLISGQMATFDISGKKMTVGQVNTSKFTSWKEGIVNIYELPLDEVVTRLNMRYNQQFVVDDEVRHYHYTFTIKNESLQEVIALIEKITPVRAEQTGSVIVFRQDKAKMRKMVK